MCGETAQPEFMAPSISRGHQFQQVLGEDSEPAAQPAVEGVITGSTQFNVVDQPDTHMGLALDVSTQYSIPVTTQQHSA